MNALLRRAGWAVTCATLAVFLQSVFRQPVSPVLLAAVGALTVAAAFRPYPSLLLIAGLGPLATVILNLARGTAGSVQFGETIVLAFLTGWTARQVWRGKPLRGSPLIVGAALLLAFAAIASGIAMWFGMRTEMQAEPLHQMLQSYVLRDYPLRPPGGEPVSAAVVFASGLLLLIATAETCAGAPQWRLTVLRMMACGAAGAAALNLLRIVTAAVQQDDVLAALASYVSTIRVNIHYADLNAAGSYFAMTLMIAVGLWTRHRVVALIAAPIIAAGLWLSGSRFAMAAVFVAAAGMALAAWRRAPSMLARSAVAVALALLVAAAGMLSVRYPEGRNSKAWAAFVFRMDLARAGLQMTAERPLTGVGLGRFYYLSDRYAPEALAKLGFSRENAHNQFVQILAELGVPGLAGFLLLIGAVVREGLKGETPRPRHVTWLIAGLCAFLLTCLGGHPLVVPDTTYAFCLALGLAAAPIAVTVRRSGRRWGAAAMIIALAIAASVPVRAIQAIRDADLAGVSTGLSLWQHEPDGTRYRWAGSRATFYIPAGMKAIRIPLRYGSAPVGPVDVSIFIDGREADRVRLTPDEGWRGVRLVFHRVPSGRFSRIELVGAPPGTPAALPVEESNAGGLFRVGRWVEE